MKTKNHWILNGFADNSNSEYFVLAWNFIKKTQILTKISNKTSPTWFESKIPLLLLIQIWSICLHIKCTISTKNDTMSSARVFARKNTDCATRHVLFFQKKRMKTKISKISQCFKISICKTKILRKKELKDVLGARSRAQNYWLRHPARSSDTKKKKVALYFTKTLI